MDGPTHAMEPRRREDWTQKRGGGEDTYQLAEGERDRFAARISMGYPDAAAELEMRDTQGQGAPLGRLTPVAHAADVRDLIEVV
ncbi:ATPase, partial [Actinomadura sp. BRA 177]|nr:ATPase [Actinomadura sp. BRA 177]